MQEKVNTSRRIVFDQEDLEFMSDYKEAYNVSLQDFVISAVKKMILEKKAKQQLNED